MADRNGSLEGKRKERLVEASSQSIGESSLSAGCGQKPLEAAEEMNENAREAPGMCLCKAGDERKCYIAVVTTVGACLVRSTNITITINTILTITTTITTITITTVISTNITIITILTINILVSPP
ncbi:Hypothetical predicted protein [Marmota monax]|uniref:Uncharacterized protein n=1 Tax=Marmota monax TaxID=9995 RepID=A0A5E4A4X7_MARMO|nr:Hypothetical predicted protein [Marmota monax]